MATFKFRCPLCRQKMAAEEEWLGMKVACPDCGKVIEIRRDDGPPSILPPPSPFPQPVSWRPPEPKKPGK